MEHRRLDQVRAVGGISEGLQARAFRLGESLGGGLQEPHTMAQIRRGGDEEQVHKPREERLGPRRDASAPGGSVMVQVHSHGGDARQCRRCQAGFRAVDEVDP